jgi:hypothetical protein
MTLPDVDTLSTLGGALYDYSPPIDPTTDRGAAAANPAYANAAMATHTLCRFFCRFNPTGGAPVLAATGTQWDAVWEAATATAPVLAHSSTGIYTITVPATVADEIPAGLPGYNSSGHAVNFRTAWENVELGSTTTYQVFVTVNTNVMTVKIYSVGTTPALVDPNDGTIIAVHAA